jgi:Sec-independent protein translocase protein TatA
MYIAIGVIGIIVVVVVIQLGRKKKLPRFSKSEKGRKE